MSAGLDNSLATCERELFLSALEKSDLTERAAFLDGACGIDHGLRQRVEDLLREQDGVGAFLETPALAGARAFSSPAGPGGTALVETVTEKPGDRIGRYKLLQKIGEGGCGVVYMAGQGEAVRRRVAVGVMRMGVD